tara:strand:+ start:125 stop:346 length:222 start_codon:yes stop_codon:yes gene_type:complete
MNNDKILYGKLPSPIINRKTRDPEILINENNFLKNELKKLQVQFDILSSKLYFLESQICCGCCGLRWATTFNK